MYIAKILFLDDLYFGPGVFRFGPVELYIGSIS